MTQHLNGKVSTVATIRAVLDVLFDQGQVVELRIPKVDGKKTRTDSGYFDDFDMLAQSAAKYDGRADGVYITLNPCDTALLARAENRVKNWCDLATSDDYIDRRRWLPIDCDPKVNGKKRPAGISSTDAEHAAAIARTHAIREWLTLQGWPDPIEADSGNGGALLYAIDLPNNNESTALVKDVLGVLASQFDDESADVDTSVHNAARIWKLYGTLAGKGDSTVTRPHRRAAILSVPAPRKIVPLDLLHAVARLKKPPVATATTIRTNFDVGALLNRRGIGFTQGEHQGSTKYVLDECIFNPDHKAPDAAVIVRPNGVIGYECFHNSCQGYTWTDARAKTDPTYTRRNGNGHYPLDEPPHPAGAGGAVVDDEPAEQMQLAPVSSFPELPEAATIDEAIGADACPWLDEYIAFSRRWSPQSYDGFHEACGLWVLSTIAARRVMLPFGGERFTSLYIALCARTSLWAKSTAAKIAKETISAAGLSQLLAPDISTPQAFLRRLAERVPANYAKETPEAQALRQSELAFAGQRGWWHEEFGSHLAGMMREGGVMADFRGHLRIFDDCPRSYAYDTVTHGLNIIKRPYLALLANLTPADLAPFARKGGALWGDGYFARFAFVTPPAGAERSRERFPEGWYTIPNALSAPLREWHAQLGIPEVELDEACDEKGKATGEFRLVVTPIEPQRCTLGAGVFDAFYRYRETLIDLVDASENHDLDGSYTRFAEKAMRIAMLLASVSNGGRIEIAHWARGQQIAERWRRALHNLIEQLGQGDESVERVQETKVLRILERRGALPARDVARFANISTGEAQRILDQLTKAGELQVEAGKRTKRYRPAAASVVSVASVVVSYPAQSYDSSAPVPYTPTGSVVEIEQLRQNDYTTVTTPQGTAGVIQLPEDRTTTAILAVDDQAIEGRIRALLDAALWEQALTEAELLHDDQARARWLAEIEAVGQAQPIDAAYRDIGRLNRAKPYVQLPAAVGDGLFTDGDDYQEAA